MKAAVYNGKDGFDVKDIAEPKLENGGAIIKVVGCGLCGSDIVKFKQDLAGEGSVLGHEVIGYIDEIREEDSYQIGDRVVLGHHVPCYNCIFCKNGNYSMCKQFKATNIMPGGFCEYLYVSEEHLKNTVFKVPEGMPDNHAAFTEPLACCLRAVKRASVKPNDVVFVIGLGSIGLLMGQVIKHFGATAIGCDVLADRVDLAKKLGFDASYKYTNDEDISAHIKENFQEEGTDKVFLTSGHTGGVNFGVSAVRSGGIILIFASIPNDKIGFANNDVYYRELTVMGAYSASPVDLKESLELLANGSIKVEDLDTFYNLEEINQAIQDTCSNKIIKAFIKIS